MYGKIGKYGRTVQPCRLRQPGCLNRRPWCPGRGLHSIQAELFRLSGATKVVDVLALLPPKDIRHRAQAASFGEASEKSRQH
eukprot:364409-Chlamydomonas_euryale.AAC.23